MLVSTPARLALVAVVCWLTAVASASASIAPATPIDGPGSSILGLDGVAMSQDGTGGLVYRKRSALGKVNIFVSRFTAAGWQPPQRVDVGQNYDSSWPAIGAGDGGRLVVTWVHEFGGDVQDRMYSAVLGPGSTRFQAPVALDLDVRQGFDVAPSLSMNRGGAAYLAYRVVYNRSDPSLPPGTIDADVRLARFQGSYWSVLGQPVDRNQAQPMRTPTATNGPRVATDANGNAVVAWSEPDDDLIDRIYARRVFGQTLGFVLQASPGTDPGAAGRPLRAGPDQFDLAVSPFGETAIAYRQQPASGASFTRPRAFVNVLPSTVGEKAGAFTGIKAIDSGTTDGPEQALGPVSVDVGGAGGFEAGLGVGNAALSVPGDEDGPSAATRLDEGTSSLPPDPVLALGADRELAAAYKVSLGGAGGVAILERSADGAPGRRVLSSTRGGAVQTLLADGSGLGDMAVAFLQGDGNDTSLVAGSVDAPPSTFNAATPPDWVRDAKVPVGWDPAPAGIGRVSYEVLVDGETVATGLRGLTTSVKADAVGDGDHAVVVTATDAGGQSTATPSASLKIDRTAPRVTVRAARRSRLGRVVLSDGAKGDSSGVSVTDSSVSWGDGKRASGRRTLAHRYARPGRFVVTVTARDKVGNKRVARRAVVVG